MRIEMRNANGRSDEVEGYVCEVYRPEWDAYFRTYDAVFAGYGIASESCSARADGAAFVVVDVATEAEAERIIRRLPDGLCDRYYPSVEEIECAAS